MRVNPITPISFLGGKFRKNTEQPEQEGNSSKLGIEDIDPSFKYYMATCQPIKQNVSFKGHWPQSHDGLPPCDDILGMPFPMTCKPDENGNPDIETIINYPPRLNYLA